MEDLEEKFSQISFDKDKNDNQIPQFNENLAAETAIRMSWQTDSRLEVKSESTKSWHEGRVTQLFPDISGHKKASNSSLLPKPILNIDYYSKTLCNKRVNRNCHQYVRPSKQDIENTKAKNKLAFKYRRDPRYDVDKLNQIKCEIFNRNSHHQNKYYERLVKITEIMQQSKLSKDNYLTPKRAWTDIVKIVGCDFVALDPFVGDDAKHILWVQELGLTLKQYLTDFFEIEYLPKELHCILSNPPYSPSMMKKIFIKLKLMVVSFALLVPKWVLSEIWFWKIWNEKDDLCFFQPQRNYLFELHKGSEEREQYSGKSTLTTIWLFGNFKKDLKFSKQRAHCFKTHKIMRIFID